MDFFLTSAYFYGIRQDKKEILKWNSFKYVFAAEKQKTLQKVITNILRWQTVI